MSGLKNLKSLREKAGLTQAELADKLYITAQSVSKWENGISEPEIDTLCRLSDIFGVSVDTLLDRNPVYKDDLAKRLKEYLSHSEGLTEDVLLVMRAAISSRLGSYEDLSSLPTYSCMQGKGKIFTYSDKNNAPKLSLVANGLDKVLEGSDFPFCEYLSALSHKNVISTLSRLERLEYNIYYDKPSIVKILEIPEGVFENVINSLVLIKAVRKSGITLNDKSVTVYTRGNINYALCICAVANQMLVQGTDGSGMGLD